MPDNIFEKLTDKEKDQPWMYMIFNQDKIIEKTKQWAKEAEKSGMTLTEYLESISPLNNKEKLSWLGKNCKDCGNEKCKKLGTLPKGYDCALWQPMENHSIKMVTNAKDAENYPISEDTSKSIEEINKLLFENGHAEATTREDCVSRQAVFGTIDDCNSDGLTGIFCSYDDGERFKEYIKKLPPVTPIQSWIPCSEKLPEKSGDYLVTACYDLLGKVTVREVRRDFFSILSKRWIYEGDEVTAWMPLPKAYEPQESEDKHDTDK